MLAAQQPSTNSPEASFIAAPAAAAIAAVLTIAQAVPAISKRLAHVQDLERQLGRMPLLIRVAYTAAQRVYMTALVVISCIGLLVVVAFLFPDAAQMFAPLRDHAWTLMAVWVFVGTAMYTNLISRLFVWVGPTGTQVLAEPLDHNANWPAFRALVDLNDEAKPLLVKKAVATTFADSLVTLLQEKGTNSDRAVAPGRPVTLDTETFGSRLGNSLLAACVIEQAHYDLNMERRPWSPFYEAVGHLATHSEIFSVKSVLEGHRSNSYWENLFKQLNDRLKVGGQAQVHPTAVLTDRLKSTFAVLASDYKGNAAIIMDGRPWTNGRLLNTVYKKLAAFPGLEEEGIRAQFAKLAIVWNVWRDVPLSAFPFPFSRQVAAVLLDRGVIVAPRDVAELAFDDPRDRQVEFAAVKTVIHEAIRLVEKTQADHKSWLPGPSVGTTGDHLKWWIAYELDFRLWAYARQLHSNNELSRWKTQDKRVVRIAKAS
jgi:hypothetical protein